jgi:hypothetical protein
MITPTRHLFPVLALLAAAGCTSQPPQPGLPAEPPANVEQLAANTYLFRHDDQRSLFVVTDAGVIVTDPLNATAAAEYRAAVAAVTRKPVRWVVYSHYHWDRVSGAQVFKASGAKVIAQERCAERFRDNPNPAVVMPDVTFADRYHVGPPGQGLDLHYFGPSHGDCLTVLVAQPAKLMQVVELVNPPRAAFPPNPEVPNIRPHNLRQFFAAVDALAREEGIAQVVASSVEVTHDGEGGEVLSAATAPSSIIAEQAEFWKAIYSTVEYARSINAVGIDSFVRLNRVDLAPFKRFDGYDEKALGVTMRRFVGYHDMGR